MNLIIPIFIVIVFLLIYNLGIYYLSKKRLWKLNYFNSKTLKYINYVSLILFLGLLILNFIFEIRPKGLYTNEIIFGIIFITGILFFLFGDKKVSNKIEKGYFYILLLIPTISIIFFGINPTKTSTFSDRIFAPLVTFILKTQNIEYRIPEMDYFNKKELKFLKRNHFI